MPRKERAVTRTIRIPARLAKAVDAWAADSFPPGSRVSANAATIMLLWKGLEASDAEEAERFEVKGGGR